MTTEFTDTIPADTILKSVLISGASSMRYANQQYLTAINDDVLIGLYEIRYQAHCSPFKEALQIDNLLAVGYEECFYLFNIETNQNILRLKMNGYFGHLYYDEEHFYVADAIGLCCINKNGIVR